MDVRVYGCAGVRVYGCTSLIRRWAAPRRYGNRDATHPWGPNSAMLDELACGLCPGCDLFGKAPQTPSRRPPDPLRSLR
eukprot:1935814-Pyramimonas_sp.AAC.2